MQYEAGGIVVGDEALCLYYGGRFAGYLVHAAKDLCHRNVVGYDTKTRLPVSHPEYLLARRGLHLVLNMVDPPIPLFKAESFLGALDFLDEAINAGATPGVHCNQGLSRAPSIALLWKAKRQKTIPDDSYAVARGVFEAMIGPGLYLPGRGIETFLTETWQSIH